MGSRTAATRWIAGLAAAGGALFPSGVGADATPVIVTTTQTGVGVAVCTSGCVQVVTVVNLSLVVVYVGAPPAPPSVRFTPRVLGFGTVRPGSSSPLRLVTMVNTGPTPVVISGVGLSGPQSGDFSIRSTTCLPAAAVAGILRPRAGCSVGVGFSPAVPGRRDALLTVMVNQVAHSVALTGRGAKPAALMVSPATLKFGSVALHGGVGVHDLSLRNAGESPLTIRGLSVSGDYAVAGNCLAAGAARILPPRTGCTLRVRFSPAAKGIRVGVLTVDDDAPGGPHGVSLTGTGVDPALKPAQVIPRVGTSPGGSSKASPRVLEASTKLAASDPPAEQGTPASNASPIVVPASVGSGADPPSDPVAPARPTASRGSSGGHGSPPSPLLAPGPVPVDVSVPTDAQPSPKPSGAQPGGAIAARLAAVPTATRTATAPIEAASRLPLVWWFLALLATIGAGAAMLCARAARARRFCGLLRA
jgi:hypothetical protein